MVDLKLTALHDILPEDVYVAMRIGDCQKLGRINSERYYKFPRSSVGEHRYGKIEVFKRVSCTTVGIIPEVDGNQEVKVAFDDDFLRFQVELSNPVDKKGEEPRTSSKDKDKNPGKSLKPKMIEAKNYLSKHNLEARLKEAMQETINKLPEDPALFIAEVLTRSANVVTRQPLEPQKTEQDAESPAAAALAPALPAPKAEWSDEDLRAQAKKSFLEGTSSGKLDEALANLKRSPPPAPEQEKDVREWAQQALLGAAEDGRLVEVLDKVKSEKDAVGEADMKKSSAPYIEDLPIEAKQSLLNATSTGEPDEALGTPRKDNLSPEPAVSKELRLKADVRSMAKQTLLEASSSGKLAEVLSKAKVSEAVPEPKELPPEAELLKRKLSQTLMDCASSGKLEEVVAQVRDASKERADAEVEPLDVVQLRTLKSRVQQTLLDGTVSGKLDQALTNKNNSKVISDPAQKQEDEEKEEEDDFGEDDDVELEDMPARPADRKRQSVSAEAFGAFNERQTYQKKIVMKDEAAKDRIREVLQGAWMFKELETANVNIIVDAMAEKTVDKDVQVVTQGDEGNVMWIIEEGTLECSKPVDGASKVVKTCRRGDIFGELALLYSTPRAATVISRERCVLWELDRDTFRNVIEDAARGQDNFQEYEGFSAPAATPLPAPAQEATLQQELQQILHVATESGKLEESLTRLQQANDASEPTPQSVQQQAKQKAREILMQANASGALDAALAEMMESKAAVTTADPSANIEAVPLEELRREARQKLLQSMSDGTLDEAVASLAAPGDAPVAKEAPATTVSGNLNEALAGIQGQSVETVEFRRLLKNTLLEAGADGRLEANLSKILNGRGLSKGEPSADSVQEAPVDEAEQVIKEQLRDSLFQASQDGRLQEALLDKVPLTAEASGPLLASSVSEDTTRCSTAETPTKPAAPGLAASASASPSAMNEEIQRNVGEVVKQTVQAELGQQLEKSLSKVMDDFRTELAKRDEASEEVANNVKELAKAVAAIQAKAEAGGTGL